MQTAIEQRLSPRAAREDYGWDECSKDGCPMQPKAYGFKTCDDRVLHTAATELTRNAPRNA